MNPDIIHSLLGELSEVEARNLRKQLQEDPVLRDELHGQRELLQDLRQLTTQPTGRVGLAVRHALHRRLARRLPHQWPTAAGQWGAVMLRTALVAAAVFVVLNLGQMRGWFASAPIQPLPGASLGGPGLPAPVVEGRLPGIVRPLLPKPTLLPQPLVEPGFMAWDPVFCQHYAPYAAGAKVEGFSAWAQANNSLTLLRREFRLRFDRHSRERMIRSAGGSRRLEPRIQDLAAEIALDVDALLAHVAQDQKSMPQSGDHVAQVHLALRALLASGSTPRLGPQQQTVRRCTSYLEQRLPHLQHGDLAAALSGLMDVAIVTGRRMERLVGRHTQRLANGLFAGDAESLAKGRPSLLQWNTAAAQVADAGRVLRLAPAFGVDPRLCAQSRALLVAHLQERMQASDMEQPDLLAAQLYGFGDLVDQAEIDRKLLLWRAQYLIPEHYLALQHICWSQFPPRESWWRMQDELRMLSVQESPQAVADASALLLCLAMNYAAPGSYQIARFADKKPIHPFKMN